MSVLTDSVLAPESMCHIYGWDSKSFRDVPHNINGWREKIPTLLALDSKCRNKLSQLTLIDDQLEYENCEAMLKQLGYKFVYQHNNPNSRNEIYTFIRRPDRGLDGRRKVKPLLTSEPSRWRYHVGGCCGVGDVPIQKYEDGNLDTKKILSGYDIYWGVVGKMYQTVVERENASELSELSLVLPYSYGGKEVCKDINWSCPNLNRKLTLRMSSYRHTHTPVGSEFPNT